MTRHIPVLLKETIENLNLKKGDIFLDATLGEGGHSFEICKKLDGDIKIIGIEADIDAIEKAKEKFLTDKYIKNSDFVFVEENFRNLDKVLDNLKIENVDGVLFDLGVRSGNFEESNRGFTFQKDEPLLMTFSKKAESVPFTAEEIINEWEEKNIKDVLYGYGEEIFAKQIAKNIVLKRKIKPIKTTFELIEIISSSVLEKYKNRKIHFATKTFQALRIAVNDEVGALKGGIKKAFDRVKKGGRIVVISFHSIEDRVVKIFFKEKALEKKGILITKKPITPSAEEISQNPRSRSGKLRIIQKI
ncbi:16S rRNA (cytosine(1402)-N(4))-methyltransferase RsmH [Patescibacteria group bacterium]|nr:16S rRNA (cytosine(1402)-N(4))-methyltransferase RsmH [Patescibacteria group bacterium]MBU4057738.1 16S rRNA (cytosine(1402)-N(4))-methyltransferase RsmH [Patescibacteria group bacterium]MBU4115983.1 16S rRNA (cytosine(1402)-N(4))-methyltransferase RsmH [Patescibacteria group bacterium]